MSKPISTETIELCNSGAPFDARVRFPHKLTFSGYVVRSRAGEEIALCDEEPMAVAIAEALNMIAGEERVNRR